ncbi:TetR family transcriptional regulator [Streptomyces ambofaciens]|uniref:Putative regulatory protein n=2 Tax=Streptomyces ambofaciens (strain ATCC 23877 / 3486 / DSM 40053 / JCM 4204 / NBRC 12836 / NRRL B-2516) TaxID=278992 RepID=A0ADD2_STRA7|nr:TetR family transcriptional regulator [Streptomyces ambofaciens]CAJ88488.1 putative regulatory protein [Streptomyces ambofaciens ATCC 23877]
MSSSSAAPRRGDRADAAGTRPPMREALVSAAFRLFLERGYEQTTVDDIVALAGVGRRSFFRYFPSKEDVVFPDHERCLADMTAFLAASPGEADPVRRVCDAARLVLRMYAENPAFSVQRYHLTKKVPGLRAYELSVVWRYERALAEYLRGRLGGLPDGTLRADVIAAAVVAAHNNALRSWLRSQGRDDAGAAVDHALRYAQSTFGDVPAASPAGVTDDVVVVVARRGAPLWQVVREVETAFAREGGDG